jgi:hypothetical protein
MSYAKSSTAIRWFAAVLVAAPVWLLTPAVWAHCPDGGECMSVEQARECLVCKRNEDDLEAKARAREKERNEMAARLNVAQGKLHEAQRQSIDDRETIRELSVLLGEERQRVKVWRWATPVVTVLGLAVGLSAGWLLAK